MCVGKALTGGHISLAATLTSTEVSETISEKGIRTFMHGPTFMANPIACAAAIASLDLLKNSNWGSNIQRIENQLQSELKQASSFGIVTDVRVLGAIGVVELSRDINVEKAIKFLGSISIFILFSNF